MPKKNSMPMKERVIKPEAANGTAGLPGERALQIYRIMVRSRVMEERMIKMSKSGEGYFWIGGQFFTQIGRAHV